MCNLSEGVYNRGIGQGIKQGSITTTIEMCKEFGVSFTDTVKRIVEKFGLSEQEAEEEVRKRWE